MSEAMSEREALRRALLEEEIGGAPEPADEELLDYLDGKLGPQAEAQLQALLASDPEASRRLLDLDELARATRGEPAGTGAPEPAATGDFAAAAGWKDFRDRLPAPPSAARRGPLWLQAAAAALLVTTLTLAVQLHQLRQGALAPVVNFASLELTSTRSAQGQVQEVAVAPEQSFRLVLSPETLCPEYRAEITRLDGAAGDSQFLEVLRRDDLDRLNAFLALPAGEYLLSVSGCDPPRQLEEYPFRVTHRGAP